MQQFKIFKTKFGIGIPKKKGFSIWNDDIVFSVRIGIIYFAYWKN
jgi:hypothetical protein